MQRAFGNPQISLPSAHVRIGKVLFMELETYRSERERVI